MTIYEGPKKRDRRMPISNVEDETWIKYLRNLHKNDESILTKEPSETKINDISMVSNYVKKAIEK